MFLFPVSQTKVFNVAVSSLSTKTSTGFDNLRPEKNHCETSDSRFQYFILFSCFPDQFKIAKVIPIFKKEDALFSKYLLPYLFAMANAINKIHRVLDSGENCIYV